MALSATALVTLDDARDELNLAPESHEKDVYLEGLIEAASKFVRDYLGRDIVSTTETDVYVDGSGTEDLLLKWPVISISSLRVDGSRMFSATTALTPWVEGSASGHYILDSGIGQVSRVDGGYFPRLKSCVKTTYTHGYSSVPEAVKRAALQLVDKWYDENLQSEAGDIMSESIGSYSVSYAQGSVVSDTRLAKILKLLQPYRVPGGFSESDRPFISEGF